MSRAVQQGLEAAFKSHQAGQLDEAEKQYRKLLRRDPLNTDVLHLFALLHHQRGQSGEAESLIIKAVKLRPEPAYYENLALIQKARGALANVVETCRAGLSRSSSLRLAAILLDTLLDLGRYDDALTMLDGLERREPLSADRLADRAFCLLRLGRRKDAVAAAQRSLAIDSASGNAFSVLAEAASAIGSHAEAAELWSRALTTRPDWVAASINLGLSHLAAGANAAALDALLATPIPGDASLAGQLLNARSAAFRAIGKRDLASRSLEAGLAILPSSADLLSNLSELQRQGRIGYALALAERAIVVDPAAAGAHGNLSLALEEADRLAEAVASGRRTIALAPSGAKFLNNLSGPFRWLGRFDTAETLHRRSLAADPTFAPAWYGLGTLQMTLGDLERGWCNYDWRTRSRQIQDSRPFRMPKWKGPVQSRGTLLVWGEQGLGDEIVYGSMLPDLMRAGIPAVVECDARMVSIFARSLPTLDFVARRNPPDERLEKDDLAAQVPMGGLGRWYRARVEEFPSTGAYLTPRPDLLAHWRTRVAELGDGPKVGFAWRSSRSDALARRFHPPVLEWAPILSQRGVTFVSLQYGEVEDDIRKVETELGVRIIRFPDLDLFNDLEGVLGLSAALDMMVTSSTTAFCLPAAVGLPMWKVTPENDLWTFGTEGYPWFPNIRLYKHRYVLPWSETIKRIGADFRQYLPAV